MVAESCVDAAVAVMDTDEIGLFGVVENGIETHLKGCMACSISASLRGHCGMFFRIFESWVADGGCCHDWQR